MINLKVSDWCMLGLCIFGAICLVISAFAETPKVLFAIGLIFTGGSGIVNGIRILRMNKKEGR